MHQWALSVLLKQWVPHAHTVVVCSGQLWQVQQVFAVDASWVRLVCNEGKARVYTCSSVRLKQHIWHAYKAHACNRQTLSSAMHRINPCHMRLLPTH